MQQQRSLAPAHPTQVSPHPAVTCRDNVHKGMEPRLWFLMWKWGTLQVANSPAQLQRRDGVPVQLSPASGSVSPTLAKRFLQQYGLRKDTEPWFTVDSSLQGFPKDCSNIPRDSPSGVQVIQPAGSPPRVVWCDMDTEGKGWTVVQRNSYNTEITWKESWSTYKYGFGNVQQDYWLGNEYLSLLTRQNIYKVRFVVEDKSNNTRYAEYDIFSVEDEPSGYPLRLGRYSGDGEDYLTTYHSGLGGIHDNMKFSTSDKDQDQTSGNCASSYGGWWYDKCQNVLLNRKGYIYWAGFCKSGECKSSLILVKPTDVCWVRQEEPILLGSSAAEKGRQY
ncbi:fibrinogen-like protein 1-like protein isoform X1 [Chrysemys picta bellii]|uniref:fibrinogen-like protein 1-like protein isoform X1 n=1 Tax=Chrysemys picta bellii TaxID=8478 RepID=UPI0032B1ED29